MRKSTKEHFAALYPAFEQDCTEHASEHKNEAVVLVDDHQISAFNNRFIGIPSWNYEDRFSKNVNTTGDVILPLSNKNSYGYVSINRDFEAQTDGIVTVVTDIKMTNASDGARLYFTSSDFEEIFEICTLDGVFCGKTDKIHKTDIKVTDTVHHFKIVFDLDEKTAEYAVDGVFAGVCKLGTFKDLSKVYVSTSKGFEELELKPNHMYIHKNFAVDEIFPTCVYPYDWEKSDAYPVPSNGDRYGNYALKFDKNTTARKNFNALCGKVVLEHYFLLLQKEDVLTVRFSDALTVKVTSETICCKELSHTFKHNVWQCLHVEADTETKEAAIFINGKNRAFVKLDADVFSYISFDYEKHSVDGCLLIDDVRVYNTYDYEDYCPKPVPAQSDDYNLIMSVCSLWHEGSHFGWDCISPFDECTPLMGYYDEGLPESADWETKYMVEHGVKALQYCWFATQWQDFSEPIKRPAMDWQQHYGYFYGKYSDMLKFCFMWENARYKDSKMTFEQFKSYIWDYWTEWYFRDDRYLTVDNKPVIHIYQVEYFVNTFGGIDGAKKVMDFMREDIKNYGFDGIVILANYHGYKLEDEPIETISKLGFDGICKYGWKNGSFSSDNLKERNEALFEKMKNIDNNLFLVPTVGAGWNILGWNDNRGPMADKSEHKKALEHCKTLIDRQENSHGLAYLSTWNEYGEGHWLAPGGLNGFDYADAWRETFSDAAFSHEDVTPTRNQMSRICHIYNDKRTPIRAWHTEEPDFSVLDTDVVYKAVLGDDGFTYEQCNVSKLDNGIKIKSTGADSKIILKDELNLKEEDFDCIHIRMKSSFFDGLSVFYTTDEDEPFAFKWAKRVETEIYDCSGFVDYYLSGFDLKGAVLKNIRIDPSNMPDVVSEITLVEFVKRKRTENDFEVVVDGEKLDIPFFYRKKDEDGYYIALNIKNGFLSACNIYHKWNRFDGTLYLKTGQDTEFLFTVGSNVCVVDGREERLEKPFYLYDKLPVLPLEFFLEKASINYTLKNGVIEIKIRPVFD